MKIFLAKLNNAKDVDPILKNMAGYGIIDPSIIDCEGMSGDIKDYNGSLLGSLRTMFELERQAAKLILAIIKDNQMEYAVKAVESIVGDIDKAKDNIFCLSVPIDFIKGK